jgi:Tfp pilus assembly protein PilF
MALCQGKRGNYERAAVIAQKVSFRFRRLHGEGHPHVIDSLNQEGMWLMEAGQFGKSEKVLRKALVSASSSLGEGHPLSLRVLGNIALGFLRQNRNAEARDLLCRGCRCLPPGVFLDLRYNLACVESRLGNHGAARRLIKEELACFPSRRTEALFDPDLLTIREYIRSL